MRPIPFIPLLLLIAAAVPPLTAANNADFRVLPEADHVFDSYCYTCHDDETQKGDVRLDNLADLKLADRLDMLNRIQEQLYIGEMPPKKKKQPKEADELILMSWLTDELRQHNAAKLDEKLQRFEYANYLDHDKLFSGEHVNLPGYTEDRHWLISEYIFNDKVNRILDQKPFLTIDGKRQYALGFAVKHAKITNPFQLPTNSGVRYYADSALNGGHLLTMLANGQEMAEHLFYQSRRNRNYLPTISAIMELERRHENTLKSREDFLKQHAKRVLTDLYGDQHDALLPAFVSVGVDPESSKPKEGMKKAPYHAAQPGREYEATLYGTLTSCEAEGDTDLALITKCEKEWFYYGLTERQIRTFVTFFHGYLDEFKKQADQHKYAKRYASSYVYKAPKDDEMAVIQASIKKHRKKGDTYLAVIDKCMAEWDAAFRAERDAAGLPNEDALKKLVVELFEKIHERSPEPEEIDKHVALSQQYLTSLGKRNGLKKLIQTIILSTEFAYRGEAGSGVIDGHGRRLMSPRDASYALSYALTESSPDKELAKAAADGRLNSRADYKREVERMLKKRDQYYVVQHIPISRRSITSITNLPVRNMRFIRDFFGYPQMLAIFKDRKRFGGDYDGVKARLVVEADRLVEHVLKSDQKVFETLLTTEDFYVFHNSDNEAMTAASERIRRVYDYFKDKDWQKFEQEDLLKHKDFLAEVNLRGVDVKVAKKGRQNSLRNFKTIMTSFTLRLENGQTDAAPYVSFPAHGPGNASMRTGQSMDGPEVAKFFNVDMEKWNYSPVQPAKIPNRKGMLTHPAWLITHAQNTETDPVKRGKWILEKLLASTVPDVPITVDAVIPEDHHKTLRQRLVATTEKDACWKCHERMNPLGYAFEQYDDFGRFRVEESIEHPENLLKKGPDKAAAHVDLRDTYKTLPVVSNGFLKGTGNAALDGEVKNAIDMTERLAKAARVRQSIIRHAFRFFLGRNETLSDSKTLIDADKAYMESGGSFNAVVISLLTSDSFIYRKALF